MVDDFVDVRKDLSTFQIKIDQYILCLIFIKFSSPGELNEWMNEWMNEPFIDFLALGPTVSAREKNNRTRTDIFNRASPPVIICISFLPPCPPLAERTWAGSGILVYLTPAFIMHQSNPVTPPPPFFLSRPLHTLTIIQQRWANR